LFQSPGRDAIAKQTSPLINLTFPSQPALQLIYDTAPIGLAFLSPDCRYLQINRRLTEICGISVEDHLGRSVRECVPALAESVENIVQSIMETGEPVTGIEVAGQRADQTDERSWITYWHPLRGPTGEIVGVNVAAEEITDRKRDALLSTLRAIFVPTLPDWQAISLPARLHSLYYAYRPLRLSKVYTGTLLRRVTRDV